MGDIIAYVIVFIILFWGFKVMKSGWDEGRNPQNGDRSSKDDRWQLAESSTRRYQSDDYDRTPAYRIEYVDADGVITTREISPASDKGTKYSLRAYCFLRHDWRTFLSERLRKVWKLEGNEILTAEEFYFDMRGRLSEFRNKQDVLRTQEDAYWARQQEKAQKESRAQRTELVECWETFGDALLLMAYFGKADNRFLKSEKDVIRGFLTQRAQADDVVEDMIKRLEKQEIVSLKEIDKLLTRIAKEGGELMRLELMAVCKEIVLADKKEHEDEAILLRRMERTLMV
jgi:uncharacterized tellurite resistance protein B-like protein